MGFVERILDRWALRWAATHQESSSGAKLRLLRTFAEDVSVFFEQIGMEEQVAIRKLPSNARQQNMSVDLFGYEWRFQQEPPLWQSLVWVSPQHPEAEVSAEYVSLYFKPPTDDEIIQLASRVPQSTTLSQMVPYVRDNLPSILTAFENGGIVKVSQHQRLVSERIFDAIGRQAGLP